MIYSKTFLISLEVEQESWAHNIEVLTRKEQQNVLINVLPLYKYPGVKDQQYGVRKSPLKNTQTCGNSFAVCLNYLGPEYSTERLTAVKGASYHCEKSHWGSDRSALCFHLSARAHFPYSCDSCKHHVFLRKCQVSLTQCDKCIKIGYPTVIENE